VAGLYGIVCHSLFVSSVAMMIAIMYCGMSQSFGPFRPPVSTVANALLLLQFPLAHSILLTRRGNRFLARLAPAGLGKPLVTTTYVAVAAAQVLLLFGMWSPSGTVWWQAEGSIQVVLVAAYAASWLLLLKAIVDAGFSVQVGSLGWWSIIKRRPPIYPPMPEAGLFRLTRQPIYGAFALTLWTVPTWTPDQLVVAVTLTGYCLAGPLFKEARFKLLFGEKFEAYRARVPYWLPWPLKRDRQQ
jgi:protein-S-isoprenylcysteine O-methyltransferase Ste14